MATAPLLYNNTKILNNVYDEASNSLATSSTSTPLNPSNIKLDQIYVSDIDWETSEFPNWIGDPKDLFGNVNNGGIYNDTTDNPKYFILRLIRTKTMRTFGIGASIGNFSNLSVVLQGSNDQYRGVLDLSQEDSKQTSMVYAEEEFTFNSIVVRFSTTDRVDVTNIFMEHTHSTRKDNYIHKFGYNSDVGTGDNETVWSLGDLYIFTETPQPYYISSSNTNDTQLIQGELIVIDNEGKFRREIYNVQLQGQTKVLIPTTNNWLCVASNRAYNTSNVPLLGDVYIYEDTIITGGVPNDLGFVRSHIANGAEQTQQVVYTVPQKLESGQLVAFAELYKWSASAIRNRTTAGVFNLFVANYGAVARVQSTRALSENFISGQDFGQDTPLIINPASDVFINVSELTTNGVAVEADFLIKLVVL